ncbi:MAG: type II toxin-antitoxin system VapC family toxin [Xanthomonadales bacterium]|nr:type II toxin-antitoxin system VapC family toxin [Xanthomonadales bacterium]
MIVLDTNVISEIFRPVPSARVLDWLQRQDAQQLHTTTITRGELLFGVYVMPQGRRRETLLAGLLRIFEERFADRVLPYDVAAADAHADLAARRRALGRSSSQSDLMIAGIVRSLGLTLATRNARDFEDCGIALVNPWD